MTVVDQVTEQQAVVSDPPVVQQEEPLAALTARLSAADARLDVLAATDGRLAATDSSLAATDGRLAATDHMAAATDSRLAATNDVATAADQRIETLAARLSSVDERLAGLANQVGVLQDRLAGHDSALADVQRSIAVEVEKHTTDALVDSRHSLQLAVNSIAQLALAMAESAGDITADVSAESATALLDSFRVDLDAVLAQLGFVALHTAVGATFDPHRHRALKRVTTADQGVDKTITRVIRDGYCSVATGRILLFADVEVGRYKS